MKIFCFGDSITYGGSYCWASQLRRYMEEKGKKDSANVYNLGVKGDSSRELLNRFENEIDVREPEEDSLIVFQIGINDSQWIKTKNNNRVQLEEFRQNLEKIWFKARQRTENIIFLGLTPVVESEVDPVDWNSNKAYRTKEVRKYEDELFRFCQQKDLKFIELYDLFLENGYNELLKDGIHPNERGHEKIFEAVKKEIN